MLIIHNKKFKFSKKTWAKPGRNYSSLYTLSQEERKQHSFVHNFYKFKHIVLIFGCIAKLLLWRMLTSANWCIYFTLQNKMLAILLHRNIKTDKFKKKTDRNIST